MYLKKAYGYVLPEWPSGHIFMVTKAEVPLGMFAQWGYTVEDARWLQAEMERQALEKYLSGEYTLGKLNENGQRLSIRITILRKNGAGPVSFITGWMVRPDGKLKLITPYGGK